MLFQSKSIATRLLLFSCVSAVIVVLAIVAFVKISMIPKLTTQALKNQTSTLAHSLRGIYSHPQQWTEANLQRGELLDDFSHRGQIVATIFLLKNGQYVRAATTLKKSDGSRAVGTTLEPESAAARALQTGQAYSGHITLFNRLHMSTYLPVAFANGVQGAVFVGIDYSSADSMLALARQMDYVVIGVGILSVLLLTVGFAYSIRVEEVHRETEDIMRTTQEGLFLLDHELRMGSQTSRSLSKILGFDVHAGANFLELLKPSVSPKTYDTAKEYIDLLLRHDVKEKLVASLNPLDCIEITRMHADGGMESRYLQIRFNRVLKGEKVTHLLVTANDITRQVRLEQELRESEQRVQDQMTMMVHILQADPRALQDFLITASQRLNEINEELRTSHAKTGMSTLQIETVLRAAHRLKGDAAALQLEAVTQSLHALETLLQKLRMQSERKGEDLLPVAVRIKELYSEVASIQDVIARIGQVRGIVSVEPPRPPRDEEVAQQSLVRLWAAFARQIADRQGKKVALCYQGIELDRLARAQRETLNTIVNQFIRNALTHGVESPAERKARGKGEAAHISVYISDQGDGTLELSFRDDGRGIHPEDVRKSAIRSGRLSAEEAARMNARQLTMLIFETGVSTREKIDEDAGRGIGLDAVKDLIAKQGGRIRIGTTPGEYCHFRVQLPLLLDAGFQTQTGKEMAYVDQADDRG